MRRVVAAGLLVLIALSACSSQPPQEAEEESIVVYSGRSEELVGDIFDEFEKATGIDTKVKYGGTSELAAQILEEGENSPADLFFAQDAGSLGAVQDEDAFVELPEELVSVVPEKFRSATGSWVGVTGRARTVVYNPDEVRPEEFPASIMDFTDEKWRDRLGWSPSNASFQSFITAMRRIKGEDETRQWLEDMIDLGIESYPNNVTIVEAVSAGEIDAGFVNHYYALELSRDNPDLRSVNHFIGGGDVGALVNVAGVGILKTSTNQEPARRFVEFLLSKEIQEEFTRETFEYPLTEGVAANEKLTPLDQLDSPDIDLSNLDDLEGTLELLEDLELL
ncbi:MAG: iron ABC transporter substrate-binding protein [Actinomycetota bacterium]